jgi:hypothetical protein
MDRAARQWRCGVNAGLARAIVRAAVAVLPDRGSRVRYREQWLADVDGAAELGMSALPVALGAAAAAVRLATTRPPSVTALLRAPLLCGVSSRQRRGFGLIQLAVSAPYLWAVVFYAYARVRLGVSHDQLVGTPYDPKDLMVNWLPLQLMHGLVAVWLAVGGWMVGAVLTPVGLVLAIGGQRAARWLPLAGVGVSVAVAVFAGTDVAAALRTWLLD